MATAGGDDDQEVDGRVDRRRDGVDDLASHRPSRARSSNRSAIVPSTATQLAVRRSPSMSTSMNCRIDAAAAVKRLWPTGGRLATAAADDVGDPVPGGGCARSGGRGRRARGRRGGGRGSARGARGRRRWSRADPRSTAGGAGRRSSTGSSSWPACRRATPTASTSSGPNTPGHAGVQVEEVGRPVGRRVVAARACRAAAARLRSPRCPRRCGEGRRRGCRWPARSRRRHRCSGPIGRRNTSSKRSSKLP